MRLLITGGSGFIGSHPADALIAQGHQVHILDDLSTGEFENVRHLRRDAAFGYTIDTCASPSIVAFGTCQRVASPSAQHVGPLRIARAE